MSNFDDFMIEEAVSKNQDIQRLMDDLNRAKRQLREAQDVGTMLDDEAEAAWDALGMDDYEGENDLAYFITQLRERLRQREAELEQRWIAVGERLPTTTDWALVYLLDSDSELDPSVNIGWYEKGTKCWQGELLSFHQRVTHWQPIPAPPKEGA